MKVSELNQKNYEIYAQQSAYLQQSNQTNQSSNQSNQTEQDNSAQQVQPSDRVELSTGSRLLQRVNEAGSINETQRSEKVQEIKNQIEAGTYQAASPVQLAEAMVKDLIQEIG